MPVTAADILANADMFRRAYPDWPHPERGSYLDLNTGNRVCGCGTPVGRTGAILYVPRRRGLSNRVPLCGKHLAAHDRQVRNRAEAISRQWKGEGR